MFVINSYFFDNFVNFGKIVQCKLQNAESDLTTISIYFDADRYGGDIEMCEKVH